MGTSPQTPERDLLDSTRQPLQQIVADLGVGISRFIRRQELGENLRGFSRWLLVVPVVLGILFACGQVAASNQPVVAAADTRSKLSADYSPWEEASFAPVLIDIISEIRGKPHASAAEIVIAGDYWPGDASPQTEPGGIPDAENGDSTPVSSPTKLPPQPTETPARPTAVPTLAVVAASPTPTQTGPATPTATHFYILVPSPSPTPTRIHHEPATATATLNPAPQATNTAAATYAPSLTPATNPTSTIPSTTSTPASTPTSAPINTPSNTSIPLPTITPQPTNTLPRHPQTETPTPVPPPTSTPITLVPVATNTPITPPPGSSGLP